MKNRFFLPLLTAASMVFVPAVLAAPAQPSAQLAKLNVSLGQWLYHGKFLATAKSPSKPWTWHENCQWSSNHLFMLCSFSNTWNGKHVRSLVVDTYNADDHAFWHYEIFKGGASPDKPFAVKMQIKGNKRIETWTRKQKGEKIHQRIMYTFSSNNKVTVLFQQSKNGTHWQTTAKGAGKKAQ